jgi:addiction module HigA family antidote
MSAKHLKRDISAIHPGEILLEEFLKPMGISQYRLAQEIHVGIHRIHQIIHGTRAISADTALRLGKFFNMEPQFWLNLQSHFELEKAMETFKIEAKNIEPWQKVA